MTIEQLMTSKKEFMEKCYELGQEYAERYIKYFNDYADLTLVAEGYASDEANEAFSEAWDEVSRNQFPEWFGGVPDQNSFKNGFFEALKELARKRLDEIG